MSDPDALAEALRAAEAKELQRVRVPGVELTHRLLRRRRRNRVVLACLLALGIAAASVTALGALPDRPHPPVNPVSPSAEPTHSPSALPSPSPEVAVAQAPTSPAENCLTQGLGFLESNSDYMFTYATMQGENGPIPKLCVGTRIKVSWVIYSIDSSWTATMVNSGYKYLDRDHPRQRVAAPAASGCAMTVWMSYEFPIPRTFKITNPSDPGLALGRPGPFYDPKNRRSSWNHMELHGFPCAYPSPSPT